MMKSEVSDDTILEPRGRKRRMDIIKLEVHRKEVIGEELERMKKV